MKRLISLLLALCLVFTLCGCKGKFRYGINTVEVLAQQDYSLAFRNNDPLYFYVTAALSVLAAEGRVDQLANKWLGCQAGGRAGKARPAGAAGPYRRHGRQLLPLLLSVQR